MANLDKKIDLSDKVSEARTQTARKILSHGYLTKRDNPQQFNLRVPREDADWIRRTVEGNYSYAVTRMLQFAIRELKTRRLNTKDFDIDRIMELTERDDLDKF